MVSRPIPRGRLQTALKTTRGSGHPTPSVGKVRAIESRRAASSPTPSREQNGPYRHNQRALLQSPRIIWYDPTAMPTPGQVGGEDMSTLSQAPRAHQGCLPEGLDLLTVPSHNTADAESLGVEPPRGEVAGGSGGTAPQPPRGNKG